MELELLGGPGSGRYPKGSGQNPQSGRSSVIVPGEIGIGGVHLPSTDEKLTDEVITQLFEDAGIPEAKDPAVAERMFRRGVQNVTLHHESPGDVSESINTYGLHDDGNFAAVDMDSDFVISGDKTVVRFKAHPDDIVPDQGYAWSNRLTPEQVLLLQFPKITGAYVGVTNRVPRRDIIGIEVRKARSLGGPGSGRYPKGSHLVGGKTFAQRFPKGILKPRSSDLKGADLLLASPFVDVVDEPRQTMFILPDGRRVGAKRGTGYEMLHMELTQGNLNTVLDGGVIRYSRGEGIETRVVPTHEQAQVIADDFKYIWKTRVFIDANDGQGLGNHERIEDTRLSADSIRNTVKRLLETKSDKPRWMGSASSGNYGHAGRPGQVGGSVSRQQQGMRWSTPRTPEEWHQEVLAISQESPAAHPIYVMGMHPKLQGETLRYVAAYGEDFQTQKHPSSVPMGNPQECYKNASILVAQHPELTYVEGFAQTKDSGGIAFLHGWAVDSRNRVIDPTYGDEGHSYFGVKYDRTAYLKQLMRAKHYGVVAGTEKTTKIAVETGAPNLRAQMKTFGGPGSGREPKRS